MPTLEITRSSIDLEVRQDVDATQAYASPAGGLIATSKSPTRRSSAHSTRGSRVSSASRRPTPAARTSRLLTGSSPPIRATATTGDGRRRRFREGGRWIPWRFRSRTRSRRRFRLLACSAGSPQRSGKHARASRRSSRMPALTPHRWPLRSFPWPGPPCERWSGSSTGLSSWNCMRRGPAANWLAVRVASVSTRSSSRFSTVTRGNPFGVRSRSEARVHQGLAALGRPCGDHVCCLRSRPRRDCPSVPEGRSSSSDRTRLGFGDSHANGKTVAIIHLGSGERLVYKPRAGLAERAFTAAVDWVNANGFEPALIAVRVCDRTSHSWVRATATRSCESTEEVRQFYQRLGGLIALSTPSRSRTSIAAISSLRERIPSWWISRPAAFAARGCVTSLGEPRRGHPGPRLEQRPRHRSCADSTALRRRGKRLAKRRQRDEWRRSRSLRSGGTVLPAP